MFSVDVGTVKVCWTRQCSLANCSIAEHQRRRRLGHQQLRTATGEHPAGVSVRTADVVLTACRTNVAVCSQVWWSRAVQRAKNDRRQLKPYTLGRSQPVETGERVSDVVQAPQAGDGSCGSVEYRLETVVQVAWWAYQHSIAVVQSGQDKSEDKRMVNGRRHWTSNAAQLTQNGKAAGNGFLNVASPAKVRVEVNSKISDWFRRVDEVGPDSKSWLGQLMTTTSCRTLEQVGLAGVQLQTVS